MVYSIAGFASLELRFTRGDVESVSGLIYDVSSLLLVDTL